MITAVDGIPFGVRTRIATLKVWFPDRLEERDKVPRSPLILPIQMDLS